MNPVVHFELPYHDAERACRFYSSVFGRKYKILEPQMGGYILLTTCEQDAKPGKPAGAIDGGMFPYKEDWPAQYPSVVMGVVDIKEKMHLITEHGGKVLDEPHAIPGFGDYVSFLDTEGNRLSLMQPKM
ncbi:MAG: VOC family protein [Cyclobacteriaceae bacterium]|nr:VOC family protein [Cyclobacteriaceae bacterium]